MKRLLLGLIFVVFLSACEIMPATPLPTEPEVAPPSVPAPTEEPEVIPQPESPKAQPEIPEQESEMELGSSRDNPIPMKQPLLTEEGITMGVADAVRGELAWKMIGEEWLDPPEEGEECLIVLLVAENAQSEKEPFDVSWLYFELVGSSNVVIDDHILGLPREGDYKCLECTLYHGGRDTGIVGFYIPRDETDLVLIWNHFAFREEDKRFFKVEARRE